MRLHNPPATRLPTQVLNRYAAHLKVRSQLAEFPVGKFQFQAQNICEALRPGKGAGESDAGGGS